MTKKQKSEEEKIYIPDTNVFLDDSDAHEHFDDAHLINEAIERQSPIWSRNYTLKDLTSRNYKEALANTPFAFEQMVHDAVKAFVDELSGHWEYGPDGKKSRYIKGYFPYNIWEMSRQCKVILSIIFTINLTFSIFLLIQ